MQSSYSVDMKVMRVASIGLLISILSIGQGKLMVDVRVLLE